ncbi:bcl-2-like protein 13 [Antennarius striatus]|uniref:bcl-2-like protein 13 n=1 Tax=Antennarius striatus TaxID=241820 RepID=UPI0035B108A3
MGDMDPEDAKSVDSGDGVALTGEENHSSNSDMVHLEKEEAEMLEEAEEEEDEELQTSVLSFLGEDREVGGLREKNKEDDLCAPQTQELLVSAEEHPKEREFMQVVPPMALPALPIVRLDPPFSTSTPSTTACEAELYSALGLHPPSILGPTAELVIESPEQLQPSQIPLSDVEEHSAESTQMAREKSEHTSLPKAEPLGSTELLCGGAALVAIVGVVAYGAVVYCRK